MERVQFQQEQMLAELKDFQEKGLFTQVEIKQIIKKRTQLETALVRRIPKKADFLRYAAYEMSLDALRKKRAARIKVKGPPTISDFAILRRQYQIFERALRKFKDDLSLWLSYIKLASSSGSRALVGRLCARAITLHPACPMLYILGANHELRYGGFSAARALLQRGIRMNPESVDLWREMVRLELSFVDVVRKRWEVLGLITGMDYDGEGFDQVKGSAEMHEEPSEQVAEESEDGDESAKKAILKGAVVKAVISNAVKENLSIELFKALHNTLASPDTPCLPSVRHSLIAHLHSHLHSHYLSSSSSPSRPSSNSKGKESSESQAALLYATRFLTPELEGEELVDTLRAANEDLIKAYRSARDLVQSTTKTDLESLGSAYAQFVSEWFEKDGLDENLKLYLLASLQSLCSFSSKGPATPASLLTAHLDLLSSSSHPSSPSPTKILKFARKYTAHSSRSPDLWLARLKVEEKFGEDGAWRTSCEEARKCLLNCNPDEDKRLAVWTWGLDRMASRSISEQIATLQVLLKESIVATPSSSGSNMLSDTLLIRYFKILYERSLTSLRPPDTAHNNKGKRKETSKNVLASDVQRVAQLYLPTAHVWDVAFDIYSGVYSSQEEHTSPEDLSDRIANLEDEDLHAEERTSALRAIFDRWRLISPREHGKAALKWGAWLLAMQQRLRDSQSKNTEASRKAADENGKDAARVIANARTALAGLGSGQELAEFEKTWRKVVGKLERDNDEEDGEEDVVMIS